MTDLIKIPVTPNSDGTFALPPVALVPPAQPAAATPAAPMLAFEFTQPKPLVGRIANQCTLPDGGTCTVLWGPDGGVSQIGPHATTTYGYAAPGPQAVTVKYKAPDGTEYTITKHVVVAGDATTPPPASPPPPPPADNQPPPANNPPDPPVSDPPPTTVDNVYAAALAGLTLPVKNPWSDTRPAYTAQATIKLPDGTVLIADTTKQAPDYVPYAGIWIYPFLLADGSRHPDLTFDCYADAVKIGNTWVDGSANYTGHHTITINGTVVEDTDDTYAFATSTVPCRNGLPQPAPQRNWDPMTFPNYGKIPGGYKPFTDQLAKADNSPTGRSLTTPFNSMSTQGAQYSIGILHGAMVPWVVDGGDENWNVVRTVEDHAWRWPIALRSRVNGLPAFPFLPECRDVSILPNCPNAKGHVNPVKTKENSPLQADPAHTPRFGVVGYLSTGSMIDLESLLCWGAYACYWGNPQYSQYEKCISYEQVRGIAWDNLQKAYAAKLCPADHPLHGMLQTVVANNVEALNALVGPNGTSRNQFGIFPHGFQYVVNGVTGLGVFQQDFLAQSVHQTIDLGVPGLDGVASFLDTFSAARMGDGVTGLFWTTASFYTMFPLVAGCTANNPTPDQFVKDWATFNNQNLANQYADQIGKTVDETDVGAGPGQPHALNSSPTNYWANLQPRLAWLPPGHPAWKLFEDKILPTLDYSTSGQFNIVPRPKLAEAA